MALKSYLVCFCFLIIFTCKGYEGRTTAEHNLKRIINKALDELVNLETSSQEATKESDDEETSRLNDIVISKNDNENNINDQELSNEIKDLEELLIADKKEEKGKKLKAQITDLLAQQINAQQQKTLKKRRVATFQKRNEKKSIEKQVEKKHSTEEVKKHVAENVNINHQGREEKANVVVDNNLDELVDFIVRNIDEEAKSKDTFWNNNLDEKAVKDTVEEKEVHRSVEVEAAIERKTKEMCNTKKKECNNEKKEKVTKSLVNEKKEEKTSKTKMTESKKEVLKSTTNDDDDADIRKLIEKILDKKSEDERETLNTLIESIFEKFTQEKREHRGGREGEKDTL